ncbi:MAG: hypothetical protein U5L05_05905 [Rubrivivax sp.]|nr:hypothetical protein [Rubrivivax sp.]
MSIISPATSQSFVAKARLPQLPARSRTRSIGMADTPRRLPVPALRTAPRAALRR